MICFSKIKFPKIKRAASSGGRSFLWGPFLPLPLGEVAPQATERAAPFGRGANAILPFMSASLTDRAEKFFRYFYFKRAV